MQGDYLEMRGRELLIDGIVIAEVTNIEDAMAISDRVSNYVAELQRKIEKLEKEVEEKSHWLRQTGWD